MNIYKVTLNKYKLCGFAKQIILCLFAPNVKIIQLRNYRASHLHSFPSHTIYKKSSALFHMIRVF